MGQRGKISKEREIAGQGTSHTPVVGIKTDTILENRLNLSCKVSHIHHPDPKHILE